MKVGDLIRRARYPSPDGRMAGRFGKEEGVGLIIEVWGNKYKIKWLNEETEITWTSGNTLEIVREA